MALPILKQVNLNDGGLGSTTYRALSLLTNALEHRAQPAIMRTEKTAPEVECRRRL